MISLFSRLMDYGVESHFRKDPSGRLAFLPFGPRKIAYFVDTKSDEEKIRSFVRMYRSASTLISWLGLVGVYSFGWSKTLYAGASAISTRTRLTPFVESSVVYMLILSLWILMLWGVYKQTVPSFTASLGEIGPEVRGQLSEISRRPRRLVLVFLGASITLLGVAIVVLVSHR